jgi:tRNA(Ile)-lysidine synthase
MDPVAVRERVEAHIREQELIPAGGEVVCLVSGGADSTCLWHVLRELGYRVRALHVNQHQRGAESEADARFCRRRLGAEVVEAGEPGMSEAELRELRYGFARESLRASGHTASDQVETILFRLVSSGSARGIKPLREDGVVRPLLVLWREETQRYCRDVGLPFRTDRTNDATTRGLIRNEILPLLRRIHPAAEQNLLALARERPRLPRGLEQTLLELLAEREGSKRADLPAGVTAVREYDRVFLEREALPLEGILRYGPWTLESDLPGLAVRGWRPGDRLAGRRKKVQDLFVDAKVPRAQRRGWPLVVRGEDVVAVPGVATAPGYEGVVRARMEGT